MRYTQYNKELERYVVPCLFKPDGTTISFSCIAGETHMAENGAGMRYPIGKDPDLVFGEAIDRLAELENEREDLTTQLENSESQITEMGDRLREMQKDLENMANALLKVNKRLLEQEESERNRNRFGY